MSAAVKLMPSPPALVLSKKTLVSLFKSLNSSICPFQDTRDDFNLITRNGNKEKDTCLPSSFPEFYVSVDSTNFNAFCIEKVFNEV